MDTRLAAQQVRLTEWAGIIHARNESGQTVKEFCSQNGITETQYFYWLRRVRAAALQDHASSFAELPAPVQAQVSSPDVADVIIELSSARIRVSNACNRNTLSMVMEVLGNA